MRIKHVEIENFRLLRHVAIGLEERTTLIVGRNNSGKTSIAELFRRLLSERALSFKPEDFSLGCHECFWTAFDAFRSEEYTSELQSLMRISYAVFCLEKTKKVLS